MKKYLLLVILLVAAIMIAAGCNQKDKTTMNENYKNVGGVSQANIDSAIDELVNKYGNEHRARIEKGVKQIAALWRTQPIDASDNSVDGTSNDFIEFCKNSFVSDSVKLFELFNSCQTHLEVILGHFNKVSLQLKRPVHLEGYASITLADEILAGYEPSDNLVNDMFANKFAFLVGLNFPYFTLTEKETLGKNWSRQEWAYARLGDLFTTRIPSSLNQQYSQIISNADAYITNYNIYVGNLVDDNMNTHFAKDLKLISHWNLRDEIKSQYSNGEQGTVCQRMILDVMLRIIKQEIPQSVVDSDKFLWNPKTNKVYQDGKETKFETEPYTRYQHLLNCFLINTQIDKYRPAIGNLINTTFDVQYEMPVSEVAKMFDEYLSSALVGDVAKLIESRLGRKLEPFDIWYDGFKTRSSIDQVGLNKRLAAMYPDTNALQKDLPNILVKLGFTKEKAKYVSDRIEVNASKGAGHAWGASMRGEKAHLRTRLGKDGIDYKGYNIGIHELGHNVEQVLTLHDVDYWMLRGVPNTAFTEAWAFIFQTKDLELLGIRSNNQMDEHFAMLDKFWGTMEIMAVSLVDQMVWDWMYKNPNCNKAELCAAVVKISAEVWNKYFAEHFGMKDCPILAIYSHMIKIPLYLSAYPIGRLIEFQIADYITGKNLGTEMERMSKQGRLIPDIWMEQAVGSRVSYKPLLDAATKAYNNLK
ncbi:MAG: hypothetical protein FWG85_01890 [Bacteroidetes bacterium]|nr:hypothetical protein [Bacteroidota bacterium]